jgi:hypothetical protein
MERILPNLNDEINNVNIKSEDDKKNEDLEDVVF